MRLHLASLCALIVVVVVTGAARAQSPTTAPAAAAAAAPAQDKRHVLAELGVREMKETNYVYRAHETTLAAMKPLVDATLMDLEKALTAAGVAPTGMPVFVYEGAAPDPNVKFTLEVGFPVDDDVTAPQGFETRRLGGDRAFSVIVVGPMSQMMAAYEHLFGALFAAGHTPTETIRERYLHWEGDESPNNVTQIEVVLQD